MTATAYTLPSKPHSDWARYQREDYVPTERQMLVIDVVTKALAAGLFYTSDVHAFAVKALQPTAEELSMGPGVEGGEFGMDVYYARQYIESAKRHAHERQCWAALKPGIGMALGTVMFNDYKRITGATIVGFDGEGDITAGKGLQIVFQGKRGALTVKGVATATQISNAIQRAHEKGLRKSGFQDLHTPQKIAPKVKVHAQVSAEPSLF